MKRVTGAKAIFVQILLAFAIVLTLQMPGANAFEAIKISRDDVALDLSRAVDIYRGRGANFQTSTAPGADGKRETVHGFAQFYRSASELLHDWSVSARREATAADPVPQTSGT